MFLGFDSGTVLPGVSREIEKTENGFLPVQVRTPGGRVEGWEWKALPVSGYYRAWKG